jgi:ribonucleotide reductase alpha subunit
MSISVINRRGEVVPLQLETISDRLKQLANMHPRLSVSTDVIAVKTVASLVDRIKTSEIDTISANLCASLIIEDHEFDDLAARITISDLHKNTSSDLLRYANELISYEYRGSTIQILHPKVVAFIKRYHKELTKVVDYSKDYLNNYFGAITLIKSYLLAHKYDNGVKFTKERPQQMLLRVAIGINLNQIDEDGRSSKETLASVIDTYELLSNRYYTHATPTLFNAGTINHTLSSCYLLSIDDSLDNIYSRLTDISKISKFSGGVGVHMSQVRASGSVIASTIGRSEGLVPLMRVYNESTRYVSQGGGKRKGSTAVYIEPWHADIESTILSQKQQGVPEMLCRDLFLALWVPDLFMERLKQSLKTNQPVMWSLMCPHECPGLTDSYGAKFDQLYLSYEAKGRYRKQINIRELWELIMATQIETGKPYLMYKDHVNRKCNQNNLGVIKSSNLCVAGYTKILTEDGYKTIKELAGSNVNVWNGEEWSTAPVRKTNTNQTLYRVLMSDGSYVDCTAYHKFSIKQGDKFVETETKNLKKGDISESPKYLPVVLTDFVQNDITSTQKEPPHTGRVFQRLHWLATHLDKEAGYMQITSNDIEWLRDIKLLANTLAVSPFIVESPRGYHLRFSTHDATSLLEGLMMPIDKQVEDYHFCNQPDITVVSVDELNGSYDTYCFNEPKLHRGMFSGVYTMNCSEITIYSDTNNIGVCNLASVCLPRFVKKEGDGVVFDYRMLNDIMQKVVINMNKVIDNNKYPLEQARNSDMKNRPIGIGVQGLSEVFMMMKTPFDSPLAMETNKKIFETMYYAALVASNELAQVDGPYETFSTSMSASGLLQFDLWGVQPTDMWDWHSLKSDIKRTGLRNSLLMAIMPVAGTSIVQSMTTEGIEPPQSNLFTRSTLSGRFQVVNKYLMRDLKSLGLWTKKIRNKLIAEEGSVQNIEEIPAKLREVYKTVYEYKLTSLIKMEASRNSYICQSSSSNRYLAKPDISLLTNAHLYSWKLGNKTSSYYTKVKAQNIGFKTLDRHEEEEEICLSCQA